MLELNNLFEALLQNAQFFELILSFSITNYHEQ